MLGIAPAPIAVAPGNGACFREEVLKTRFDGPHPLPRHVRTRVRSPQTNDVIERWFGTLKFEHLFRGVITDGDALDTAVHRFRIFYKTIRPQAHPRHCYRPSAHPIQRRGRGSGLPSNAGLDRALRAGSTRLGVGGNRSFAAGLVTVCGRSAERSPST